jgi:hypothetical protein
MVTGEFIPCNNETGPLAQKPLVSSYVIVCILTGSFVQPFIEQTYFSLGRKELCLITRFLFASSP